MNITETIFKAASQWPDHTAIIFEDGHFAYAWLQVETEKVSQALKLLGVSKGKVIGVQGSNKPAFIVAMLAVMKVGACALPISTSLTEREVAQILSVAEPDFMLAEKDISAHYLKVNSMAVASEQWFISSLGKIVERPPGMKDFAYIRFTSGTTGTSKGVGLSHKAILERTEAANAGLQLKKDDRVVWVLSMAYHFVVSILLYLRYGSTVILVDGFLAKNILDAVHAHRATFIYASPLHARLLANDTSGQNLDSCRRIISTSTGLNPAVAKAFYKRFSKAITQAYGIIEVGLPLINLDEADLQPEAVGKQLPAYEAEILDDHYREVPPGQTGKLGLRGPGMFDAYLYPFNTREKILKAGWFITGDLALKDENGLVVIQGREKSMINVAGNKVFPEEVEPILLKHPAVKEVRVSGFTHRFTGENVQAEVVLHPDEPFDSEELIAFSRTYLSSFKVPQRIVVVTELSKTDSGKIKRN